MREPDSADRLLLLAVKDGDVVGSGIADRSDTAGAGFVAPRVLSGHRRTGVGSALLRALAEHCSGRGLPTVVAGVDDEGSLTSAEHFGFVEVDREVEQVRAPDEPAPTGLPAGVEVIEASQRPDVWAASVAPGAVVGSRHISSAEPCTGLLSTDWRRSTPGPRPATCRRGASTSNSAMSPPGTPSPSPGRFRSPSDGDEPLRPDG